MTSAIISVSVTIAALRFQAVPSIPRMNVFFKAYGLLPVLFAVTAFDNTGENLYTFASRVPSREDGTFFTALKRANYELRGFHFALSSGLIHGTEISVSLRSYKK